MQLHTISGKDNHGLEQKAGLQEFLPNLAPIHTDMNSPRNANADSLSNSPIIFSSALKSKFGRSILLKKDNNLTKAESQQENALKVEWVEQYENGVYITLTKSPSGEKGLKRVRFR